MLQIREEQGTQKVDINLPTKINVGTPYFKKGYEFPIARLVNVHYNPEKIIKKNGVETPTSVLSFTFIDAYNKEKSSTFYYYPIESTDAKFNEKLEWQSNAIKHIFDETVGKEHFDKNDFKGNSFEEFFENIAKAFNKTQVPAKVEGKTVPFYTKVPVYLKQTLYKNRAGLPLLGNFLQVVNKEGKQVECELDINPMRESVTKEAQVKNSPLGNEETYGFGDISGDLPSFNVGY